MVSAEAHTPSPTVPTMATNAAEAQKGAAEAQNDTADAISMEADEGPTVAAGASYEAPHGAEPDVNQQEDEQQREQVSAAMLSMLASVCKEEEADKGDAVDGDGQCKGSQGAESAAQQQSPEHADAVEHADAATEEVQLGMPGKRTSSAAGLLSEQQPKQQRRSGSEPQAGSSPSTSDSPVSMGAATAAAIAGLHKLSSASASELEAALIAHRGSGVDYAGLQGLQRQVLPGNSGSSSGAAGTGAGTGGASSKETPQQIMEQLVKDGLLPSCGPDTHCYVKCGKVQGVFSLASGSILCLCKDCSEDSIGSVWFAPAAFERHGGMAASKKWRGSIQVCGDAGGSLQ